MPGFFGQAKVPGGLLYGSPVAHSGQFGPTFTPTVPTVFSLKFTAGGPTAIFGGITLTGWMGTDTPLGPGTVGTLTAFHSWPFLTGGVNTVAIGDGVPGHAFANEFVVSLQFGVDAQTLFTSVTIQELGFTRLSAAATFDNGGGCGPATFWSWNGTAGIVAGNSYTVIFA